MTTQAEPKPPEIYKSTSEKYDLQFHCRPGTSDLKSVREVVDKNDYQRKWFKIEAGERWLDIGAYIGAFTCLALRAGARVEAFEPFPESFKLMMRNVELNDPERRGFYNLNPFALVSRDPGKRDMGINRNGNLWRNSIVKTPAQGGSVEVQSRLINDYIQDAECVKMDVEGSEFELLEDLRPYAHLKKLVFEWGFDVDPSIDRFYQKCAELKQIFTHVKHATFKEGEKVHQWFPPCTKVFCWNDPT